MSTITRNLSNISGANVTNPNANAFTSTALEAFANDAAFEAVHTPQAGSLYWNTTEQLVRQYNGTTWQNDKTSFETQNDSTTTGSLQTVTPTATAQIIRFTQGSLASIRAIVPTIQKVIYFVNGQASTDIVIKNEDAGATAAQRIVTGSGNDFTLKPTQMLALVYDSVGLRWRLAGGGSGGGLVPTAANANFSAVAGINYLTDTSGGPVTATLPAGANGSTIRFVDATESWGTNNLTITPASGQIIDMLAADETLVCDVVRGWVELSWDGTRWAFSSLASTTVGEASASSPGIVSIGTQTFAGNKTFNGSITPSGGIVGKTDGVAVSAGNVGQLLRESRDRSAQTALTTGVSANITANPMTLTAGVWLVTGSVSIIGTATSARLDFGLSTTSATLPPASDIPSLRNYSSITVNLTLADLPLFVGPWYVNISSTTTLYLVGNSVYSGGTCNAYGFMQAVRITA